MNTSARIDNRQRARRVLACLIKLQANPSDQRYYQAIYDHSFFII
jgi:hypothetical protein